MNDVADEFLAELKKLCQRYDVTLQADGGIDIRRGYDVEEESLYTDWDGNQFRVAHSTKTLARECIMQRREFLGCLTAALPLSGLKLKFEKPVPWYKRKITLKVNGILTDCFCHEMFGGLDVTTSVTGPQPTTFEIFADGELIVKFTREIHAAVWTMGGERMHLMINKRWCNVQVEPNLGYWSILSYSAETNGNNIPK